jgi:predicted nucleic acid-binding protein
MAENEDMTTEVFLDASYAIALSSPNDRFHHRALLLADQLDAAGTHLITTRAVLLEIGNALSKQRYRAAAIKLLDALEADASVEIVPLSEQLYARALQFYRERLDKEWGLTDCMSFVVMQERGISEALSADEHFPASRFPGTVEGKRLIAWI